jgi:hypothetical protein
MLDQVRGHLHPSPSTLRVQWISLFIILSEVPISILAFTPSLVCMDLLCWRESSGEIFFGSFEF